MKIFGIITLVLGCILLGIYALIMNTSVEVSNNFGLLNDRQNYLYVGGILVVIGIVILLFLKRKKTDSNNHHYKITHDKAKIAEYKGNLKESLDMYLETLYHLENDYKNSKLAKDVNDSRTKLIASLKVKVEELKQKIG